MRRRHLLTLAGTAITATLTGCAESDPDGSALVTETTSVSTAPATAAPESTTESTAIPTPTPTPARKETWPSGPYAGYETAQVRVVSPGGDHRGSVTAAVAATGSERYLGLSDAASMPEDGGMLFVYETVEDRTFVMRRMDFGLDIVYADAEGAITSIHHAPAPGPDEDGSEQRYSGRGQYVLELNFEWADRHGVEVGDILEFEL